jgi:hypothetical protein
MTDNPVRSAHWKARGAEARNDRVEKHHRAIFFAVLCASMLAGGCAEHGRPKLPWSTASVVRPRIPAPPSDSANAEDELARELPAQLRLDLAPPESSLLPQSRPARPRVATPQPAAAESSKPGKPFVVPQLSVEESNEAQQEATASLSEAEKSVAATRGKTLNAAQADMASKISGFITDARTAAASGDWPSARNLARKAQLLSQELAKSLE